MKLNLSFFFWVKLSIFSVICLSLMTLPPAQAQTAQPLKLGAIFSLTGFGAKGGIGELRAVQMAVDEINNDNNTPQKIILVVEDNQSDLKASVSAFKKLVELDRIDALVGPNWSEFTEVVAPLAERAKIPMITPSGVLKTSTKNIRQYVFSLMQPALETNRPLAEAVLATPGITDVLALVHDNVYLENCFVASKEIWNGKLKISEVRISSSESPDYRSILLRGARKPGTAIFASVLTGQYAALLKARQQLGITAPVFAVDIIYDGAFQAGSSFDKELLNGVIATDFKTLGSEDFHNRFFAKFKETPLNYAAKAYDAVQILMQASITCGKRNYECIRDFDRMGESGHLKFGVDHVVVSEGRVADNYVFKANAWERVQE